MRERAAEAVWAVAGACALLLVVGALLSALDVGAGSHVVGAVKGVADLLDLGLFDRRGGIFEADGASSRTKEVLVNWGLAAVAWLILGRVAAGLLHR